MEQKFFLGKKLLIFLGIVTVPLMVPSLYGMLQGTLLQQNAKVLVRPMALFGFILLPLGAFVIYQNNKCTITPEKVKIGRDEYLSASYNFSIVEKEPRFSQRPIMSLHKKTYYKLIIRTRDRGKIVLGRNLELSRRELVRMKGALPDGAR